MKDSSKISRDMLGRKPLTGVDQAKEILFSQIGNHLTSAEIIPLEKCLGRVTAEPIRSTENLPAYPRSTMDGFAVCSADTFGASESMPAYLNILGDIEMGTKPDQTVQRGNCMGIATGGLMPPGADAVVMFEHTIRLDETMIEITKGVGTGENVIQSGDDIAIDNVALPAGKLLRSQDLGLLAGIGKTEVNVHKRVKVGIISTGDEIIPYKDTPAPGQIRNINSVTIGSEAIKFGAEVKDYGIVKDSEESFFHAITEAKNENDIVIFSGGSSVGMRDLGERAIDSLGEPGVLVHGVTLKPGKPILMGLHDKKILFGLPGHPVSAMVCFDLFVKPCIKRLTGNKEPELLPTIHATLGRNINSAAGRKDIVRVLVEQKDDNFIAQPILGKSGSISTLSRANGYIIIPESLQGLTENSKVEVHLYL